MILEIHSRRGFKGTMRQSAIASCYEDERWGLSLIALIKAERDVAEFSESLEILDVIIYKLN